MVWLVWLALMPELTENLEDISQTLLILEDITQTCLHEIFTHG